ncbi:heme NO-binding domain-containing protein [Bowmanella yangjiangensis]|uniref:Heme NO-binding domain-containing protein n=1 Tax=Bowmanella yangjiangensis TaxID=2811230 RepID=A0ABS3CVT0_9ALTE|nr:heme NO-binding domain-containing protein [Bowmanella yangjiangensis]
MLGIIFTSFVDMVEERFPEIQVERLLETAAPQGGGAYTAVGYYAFEELQSLVVTLSNMTNRPVKTLLYDFGVYLFDVLKQSHESLLWSKEHLFDLLACLDTEIHRDVMSLYAQANPPRFTVIERDEQKIVLLYESARHLEALAHGLVVGAASHYQRNVSVDIQPSSTALGSFIIVRLL